MNDFIKQVIEEKFASKSQQRYFYAKANEKGAPKKEKKKWKKWASEFSSDTNFKKIPDKVEDKEEDIEEIVDEKGNIMRGDIPTQIKKSLIESHKTEVVHVVCEGLTATQVEKIKSLAESVEFSTEEEYKNKLETIRENYFPSGTKRADENQLHEELGDVEDKKVSSDPFVNAVAQAISKTKL